MKSLTFSNSEIKKIVDIISKGKKWDLTVNSNDNKFAITLVNNIKKSKIDVLADNKYVDDYPYDINEDDDVYATVLNVLDYLTNLMNKYNKRNAGKNTIKENDVDESKIVSEKEIAALNKVEADFLKSLHKNNAYGKNSTEIYKSEDRLAKSLAKSGCINIIRPAIKSKDANIDTEMWVVLTKKGELLVKGLLEHKMQIDSAAEEFQEAISKGMLTAYSKRMKDGDVHYTCKACKTNIPKYRGSYPTSCPNCGESIKQMKEADKDEAIWGGPFKRGEVVKVKLNDPDEFYDAKLVSYDVTANEYAIKLECGDVAGKIIQGIKRNQIK